MNIREGINLNVTDFRYGRTAFKNVVDQLVALHNIKSKHIVLDQEWHEDMEEKTGWSGSG